MVRDWKSGEVRRLRGLQERPVCNEVGMRYMSCVGGNRKGLCGFWELENLSDSAGYEAGERSGTGHGSFRRL